MNTTLLAGLESFPFKLLMFFVYFMGVALFILTLLMPYFIWRIKQSVERSEKLIQHASNQVGFLATIESQLRNNIAPSVISTEQNIRADFNHRYGVTDPIECDADNPVYAEKIE
jgi:hypothetical protein